MTDVQLRLYDAAGRLILERALDSATAEQSVALTGLNPGVYFVVVEHEAGLTADKLVVLR